MSLHGGYQFTEEQYAAEVRHYSEEIGKMEWAAIMDWMCEPFMLEKTGLQVWRHQQLTVANYLRLMEIAPDLPWVPILQGFTRDDYMRCVDMYDHEWIDLTKEPVVGLGSVCRRQGTTEIEDIICELHSMGIRLHAFGFKTDGLATCAHMLESSDSLAWSWNARRNPPMDGCTHKNCNSCRRWAMRWRDGVMNVIAEPKQWRLVV